MPKKSNDQLLTEAEFELMVILWKLGEGNVSEVLEHLPKERDLAYTTVSTILRILEQKKLVKARKEGRGHIYVPSLSKEAYETKTLKHVVDKVFDGTPVALVKNLIEKTGVSSEELQALKELIKKAEKRNG